MSWNKQWKMNSILMFCYEHERDVIRFILNNFYDENDLFIFGVSQFKELVNSIYFFNDKSHCDKAYETLLQHKNIVKPHRLCTVSFSGRVVGFVADSWWKAESLDIEIGYGNLLRTHLHLDLGTMYSYQYYFYNLRYDFGSVCNNPKIIDLLTKYVSQNKNVEPLLNNSCKRAQSQNEYVYTSYFVNIVGKQLDTLLDTIIEIMNNKELQKQINHPEYSQFDSYIDYLESFYVKNRKKKLEYHGQI